MNEPHPRDRWAYVLRGFAFICAISLIALWIVFFRTVFMVSQGEPAPYGIMMPLFFCTVALGAGLAALRGDGIPVALAGGFGLFPMGIVLAVYPGPTRMIGVLDVALIATGIAIMRRENRALAEGGEDGDEPAP